MAATSPREYKKIEVTYPVFVERINEILDSDKRSGNFRVILIMGPTGAGKSTFVEALGLREVERISSNQLDGFTHSVSTFRMKGITISGGALYLVDSPGFADTKISEMAIVSMVQKWLKDNMVTCFSRIVYLTPITHIRLPGSQRQVLKTFQALTGVNTAESITVITTMWDAIGGDRARKRAEGTYKQLESEIWKEFIEQGARIVRFHNTQDSALLALDEAFIGFSGNYFHVENKEATDLQHTPFAVNLYTDLQSRIEKQQLEIATILSDLACANVEGDELLQSVLRPRLEEAEHYLAQFQAELQHFGPQAAPGTTGNSDEEHNFVTEIEEGLPTSTHHVPEPQRRRFVRALNSIMWCGCCGKGVVEKLES